MQGVIGWIGNLIGAIGRVALQLARWLAIPFVALWRFYWRRSRTTKIIVAVILSPWLLGYAAFAWNAGWIRGVDLDYPATLGVEERTLAPGVAAEIDGEICGRSYIVDAAAGLIDFNVNRNAWIPSNPFYKMGFLFLIDWERTKFFDNKAAFQLGVHQAVHRTLTELTDTLGRVRGTSRVDPALEEARGNIQFDPYTWIFNPFSTRPFGPTTRSQTYFRSAETSLREYQSRLTSCDATFDARADNLLLFLDRIAADIGATSANLMERAETHNSGWFDTQADNIFMFAKGQMYAYYGILAGARADFAEVIESRGIGNVWDNMTEHIAQAIALSPMVIANGAEDAWMMPSHLTAIGFYILRARSNLVEMRSVLDR